MESEFGTIRLGPWDYSVIGLVLLITVAIGFYHSLAHRRKSVGISELLMAGRSMGVLPVALSVLASYFSAIAMLGLPVEVFFYGTQQWMFVISYSIVVPVTAYCILPVFHNAKVTSAYEYLELRFSPAIRRIASVLYIIQTILFTAVVLYAPSLSISHVTGISLWTSVGITGLTCIVYTALGGMRAVLWTDAFQIVVMFIASMAIVIKGCIEMGGLEEVWKRAETGGRLEFFNMDIDPTLRQSFWSATIGGTFTWLSTFGVSQSIVQRYLTAGSLTVAQSALWVNLPGLIIMFSIFNVTGLVIYSRYWDCDLLKRGAISSKDQILPFFVMDILGPLPGFPGLFIASIASATLSTMSSNLNGLTAVTLEDFIRPCVKTISEERATLIAKLVPVFYGGLSIGLVVVIDQLGTHQAAISLFGMVGGPLLGIFLLGMFVPWADSVGGLTGFLAGLVSAGCIGIGSYLAKFQWPTLPVRDEACPWINETRSFVLIITPNMSTTAVNNESAVSSFKLSFLWYGAVSCIIVFIVGLAVSYFTRKKDAQGINPFLLSPAVRWISKAGPISNSEAPFVTTTNGSNSQINPNKKTKDDLGVSVESDTFL